MPKSPTRSEIESALKAGNKRTRRKKKSDLSDTDFGFGEPPRRQQVLGGDLTGVNRKKRFGIFSRYSDINIANWIGAFVIVLICLAFFWPQHDQATEEILPPSQASEVVEISNNQEIFTSRGGANFAKDNDKQRADAYREQEVIDNRVKDLIKKGTNQIRARQFTQPRNNNAVLTFKQVLTLEPTNSEASTALDKIRQHYLYRGVRALEENNLSLAKSHLDNLEIVDSSSIEFSDLQGEISDFENSARVDELLAQASRARRAGNLILPARSSALSYFQQVLDLDEENERAISGIKLIADNFIQKANDSVLASDFGAASAHLATVSLIDPEHKSIALIEAMIKRAKPLANVAKKEQQNTQPAASSKSDGGSEPDTESPSTSPNSTGSSDTQAVASGSTIDEETNQSQQQVQSEASPNNRRTPAAQASEQETFDVQYLQQGLDAYYGGDYERAASLLQPLADKGIARAQMRLAYMHFLGRGFPRSRAEADKIVRSALPAIRDFANEGRGWAQSDLGSLYEDGLVLPRDYGEAVYWYRTAAEKGYPGAQTNLGIMYARGRGVATSRRTAIEWFQRAAKQGDRVAQRNLESMGVN